MKKCLIALFTALSASAFAGDGVGFYVGAGAACQIVPAIEGTRYSAAPVVELGYKGNWFGISASGSLNKEAMISLDINSCFPLAESVNLVFGGGYGAIYRRMEFTDQDVTYESKGFADWPHANLGVEFAITDNLGLRLVGELGYARCTYEESAPYHDYYRDYYYYDSYAYDGWQFASRNRAVLVWNF